MRIETYRNFIAIAECGSISEAARRNYISQPALSNQIKTLETMYRTPLLDRDTRQLKLTDAGRILYKQAKAICRLEDETKQEILNSQQTEGSLNIGISSDLFSGYWRQLLQDFGEENPLIRFNVYDNSVSTLFSLLRTSIVEVSLIQENSSLPCDMKTHHTIKENPVVITLIDNPWFTDQQAALSISDLKDVPLCITRSYVDPLTNLCLSEGFVPKIRCVSNSQQILIDWVELGYAAGFVLLSHLSEFCRIKTVCRSFYGNNLESQRNIISKNDANLSPIAERFIAYATRQYQGH